MRQRAARDALRGRSRRARDAARGSRVGRALMDSAVSLTERAATLSRRYQDADAAGLLRGIIEHEFPGRVAVLSSFGAESALLLAVVAEIDPSIAVIFLDTGKIFPETLQYISQVEARLG